MSPFFMDASLRLSAALFLLAGLAGSPAALAQSQKTPAYEVAAIKPNQSGDRPAIRSGAGGRLNATNATLKVLIGFAYNVRDYQVSGGPSWLDTVGYDIIATPEHPVDPTPDNIDYFRQMLQSLLAERFKLTFSRQERELPVYALVVARDGPKLKEVEKWKNAADMRIHGGAGQMIAEKATMALLAQTLSNIAGRSVVDQTGLTGYYDFKLEWTPDEAGQPAPDDRPSLFTAVQEQLGLKLESQKGLVEILVIDYAEKPPAN
jgi:bla regulator protein blaR1